MEVGGGGDGEGLVGGSFLGEGSGEGLAGPLLLRRRRLRGALDARGRPTRDAVARAPVALRAAARGVATVTLAVAADFAVLVLLLAAAVGADQLPAHRRAIGGFELGHEALVQGTARAEAVSLPRDRSRKHLIGVGDAEEVGPVVAVGGRPRAKIQRAAGAQVAEQRAGGHDRVEVVIDRGVKARAVRVALGPPSGPERLAVALPRAHRPVGDVELHRAGAATEVVEPVVGARRGRESRLLAVDRGLLLSAARSDHVIVAAADDSFGPQRRRPMTGLEEHRNEKSR